MKPTSTLNVVFLLHGLFLSVSAQWYMQSQNMPTLKICMQTEQEYFPAIVDERGKRFIPRRPGLSLGDNTVSFESVDYPGRYLRQLERLLYTEPSSYPRNPDSFNSDASFKIHVNQHNQRGYYSFESQTEGGFYIRHTGAENQLIMSNSSGEESFGGEVSFRLTQQDIMLQPKDQEGCSLTHCKLAVGVSNEAFVADGGELFNMVSPGLNGRDSTVSFEVQSRPSYYLRQYAGLVYADPANTTRSPSTFTQDASMVLQFNRFYSGYYGIELSFNHGYFLRHISSLVKFMDSNVNDPNFAPQASWSIVQGPIYLESQNYATEKIALDQDEKAVMSSSGARFNLVYPALTGTPGTVSIESFEKPGWYLRHFDSVLYLEDSADPRNPGVFTQDASFIVRRDLWYNDYLVMECTNYRNHSIRHSNAEVKIAMYNPDGSDTNFKEDASFIVRKAPLIGDDVIVDDTGKNVGAIVGGVIGLLILVALIAGLVVAELRFNWSRTVIAKVQSLKPSGSGTGGDGGIENPTYPSSGFDEQDSGGSPQASRPATDPQNVFSEQEVKSQKPVIKLSKRLSDTVSKLKRSSRPGVESERRIEVPSEFDLNVKDFQPGTQTADSKGSFDNPMYGLTRTSVSVEEDSSVPSSLNTSQDSSVPYKRNDSIFDSSPTLTATDQAMMFLDDQINKGSEDTGVEHISLEGIKPSSSTTDEEPVRKKKVSASGISPIAEDDVWNMQ